LKVGLDMISYAQNLEDVMLWRALGHVREGCYVDIGAQDPVVDSVSLVFHQAGWRGVHVEPVAEYASQLQRERPGDLVIQAAVGESANEAPLYEIPNSGISTLDRDTAERHRSTGFTVLERTTSVVTLESVFEQARFPDVHWLKVDVEGFEPQVLAGWGSSQVLPWVVVVESTLPLQQIPSHERWESMLISRGYSFAYFDGLNRFYVSAEHDELRAAFQSPPNVFDGYTLSGTASAPAHRAVAELRAAACITPEPALDPPDIDVERRLSEVSAALSSLGTSVRAGHRDLETRIAESIEQASGGLAERIEREVRLREALTAGHVSSSIRALDERLDQVASALLRDRESSLRAIARRQSRSSARAADERRVAESRRVAEAIAHRRARRGLQQALNRALALQAESMSAMQKRLESDHAERGLLAKAHQEHLRRIHELYETELAGLRDRIAELQSLLRGATPPCDSGPRARDPLEAEGPIRNAATDQPH
jgi:FkbM family methyltransferase